MVAVALLAVAVITLFARPRRLPLWAGPVGAALVGVVTTAVPWHEARGALDLLRSPLAFLVFAVPLAVLLDRIGVFTALAASIDGGRHLLVALWVLAALVTAFLNLDASVVLLTPLYIRVARRHGLSVEAVAFQPALLACLASSPLPVSNLTNLIAAERFDLDATGFVRHLALPTVAACAVGWWCYRRAFRIGVAPAALDEPVDAQALRRGLPIVAFVMVGFTLGDVVGLDAWIVALLAAVWAALVAREVPWRVLPAEAVLVASSLGVLVAAATPHLRLEEVLDHPGVTGRAAALAFGVVGATLANNLPAVLAGVGAVGREGQVWPLLLGVNIAPAFVLTGALSGLLWRDTARRLGVEVSPRRYASVGLRVAGPALVVAGALALVLG